MTRLIYLLTGLLAFVSAGAQPVSSTFREYMTAQARFFHFSGTVLIARGGQILYNDAFGQADEEWQVANTIDTKYRIGSLTKLFTAACITNLIAEGRLGLHDTLRKFVRGYPNGNKVTIEMLMRQTTGIPDYLELPDSNLHPDVIPYPPVRMISLFEYAPFAFEPGTQWQYSNSNYFLLGYVIEQVTGRPYAEYVQEIIHKAAVDDIGFDRPDTVLRHRAKGYIRSGSGQQNAPFYLLDGAYSAGGLYGSAPGLYKWVRALREGRVLDRPGWDSMASPGAGNYGYGLWIDSLFKRRHVWHNGGIPGFSSSLAYWPKDDLYVIVLSNNESNATSICNSLSAIAFGIPVSFAYGHRVKSLPVAVLKAMAGRYGDANELVLVADQDKLFRVYGNGERQELLPESENRVFYADGSDRYIEFFKDAEGRIVKLLKVSWGLREELKRKKGD